MSESIYDQLKADPRTKPFVDAFLILLPVLKRFAADRAVEVMAELVGGDSEEAMLKIRRVSTEQEWISIQAVLVHEGNLAAMRAVADRNEALMALMKVLLSLMVLIPL